MSYETALVWFAIITVFTLMLEIWTTYITKGFGFGFSSNRNPQAESSGFPLRIKRTYQNQIESAAYIVPVLAAASVTGLEHSGAELAALLLVVGRALYIPLYYSGVSFIRVPAFGLAMLSALYIGYILLTSGL